MEQQPDLQGLEDRTIFRVQKDADHPYSMVPKALQRDASISLECRGLLQMMLSFPDNWDFNIRHLAEANRVSRNLIARILLEAIEHGYVVRDQGRRGSGRFGRARYLLYEAPQPADSRPASSTVSRNRDTAGQDAGQDGAESGSGADLGLPEPGVIVSLDSDTVASPCPESPCTENRDTVDSPESGGFPPCHDSPHAVITVAGFTVHGETSTTNKEELTEDCQDTELGGAPPPIQTVPDTAAAVGELQAAYLRSRGRHLQVHRWQLGRLTAHLARWGPDGVLKGFAVWLERTRRVTKPFRFFLDDFPEMYAPADPPQPKPPRICGRGHEYTGPSCMICAREDVLSPEEVRALLADWRPGGGMG